MTENGYGQSDTEVLRSLQANCRDHNVDSDRLNQQYCKKCRATLLEFPEAADGFVPVRIAREWIRGAAPYLFPRVRHIDVDGNEYDVNPFDLFIDLNGKL